MTAKPRTVQPVRLAVGVVLTAALAIVATGIASVTPDVLPDASAASTDPPPAAPLAPGLLWGVTNLTVSWKPVSGAAHYVVTVESNATHAVKTYNNSTLPSNQAVIAKTALPSGGASGYYIRVRTKAANGQLSTYSTPAKAWPAAIVKAVTVRSGDSATTRSAAVKAINACTKSASYGAAAAAGGLIIASFIPGVDLTVPALAGALAKGAGSGAILCVLKKVDPLR